MCNLESGLEGCRWTKEIFHLTTVKVEFLPAWVRPSHNCHQCNLERHNIMYSAQLGTLLPWLPPVPPENTYQHSLLKAPWSHTSATRWYMLSWLVTYCPRSSQLVFILIRICLSPFAWQVPPHWADWSHLEVSSAALPSCSWTQPEEKYLNTFFGDRIWLNYSADPPSCESNLS